VVGEGQSLLSLSTAGAGPHRALQIQAALSPCNTQLLTPPDLLLFKDISSVTKNLFQCPRAIQQHRAMSVALSAGGPEEAETSWQVPISLLLGDPDRMDPPTLTLCIQVAA